MEGICVIIALIVCLRGVDTLNIYELWVEFKKE